MPQISSTAELQARVQSDPGLPLAMGPSGVDRLLTLIRQHLDMELALVSEFTPDEQIIRRVDGEAKAFGLEEGTRTSLSETYCWRMTQGYLPSVVPNAKFVPQLRNLDWTWTADIGSYIGVPIRFRDGTVYGTLCCLSHETDLSLSDRDEQFLYLCAHVMAQGIESERNEREVHESLTTRIRDALESGRIGIVLQPIFDLHTFDIVGYEALSRINDESPESWFAEAAEVGLDLDLERATKQIALSHLEQLPSGTYLSLNLSPHAFGSPLLLDLFSGLGDRVVLELTEHEDVSDYQGLREGVRSLRERGTKLAVDDVGSGFASLRHIVRLEPDILKLDVSLIRDIDATPRLRALASSLVRFAEEVDAAVVAEGIESEAEALALREVGVDYGQGFYLGMPQKLEDLRGEGFLVQEEAWI